MQIVTVYCEANYASRSIIYINNSTKKQEKHSVLRFFYYTSSGKCYLMIDSGKLKIYFINPSTTTKNKTKEYI